MVADENYVTLSAWVRTAGRPDAIDEIADQFERPLPPTAGESTSAMAGWPQRSRGWDEEKRLHQDRRAS